MSFKLVQLESGLKVTPGLRHLGFWLKENLTRVLNDLLGRNQTVYLDLGAVSYVDESISKLIEEARANHPNLQLVGFPRSIG